MLTAIVGILLGNLLIATLFAPALQRLRDILEKFARIDLPHESVWPHKEKLTAEQRGRAEERAADEFNLLFREYEMSFNSFRKVALVFVAAIVILACAVVWQTPLSLRMRLAAMVLSVGTIVPVGLFLQRAIAPTSSQLVSIDFLQNNFANLHLESFFDSSNLIPTPKKWVKPKADQPRFLSDQITEEVGGQVGIRFHSSDCRWNSVDECVDFHRRSLLGFSSFVISRIDTPRPDAPQAILQMFKEELERCKRVSSADLPSGITVLRGRGDSRNFAHGPF